MTEIANEFVTPVRGPSLSSSLRDKEGGVNSRIEMSVPATVTPTEPSREELKTKEEEAVSPVAMSTGEQMEESSDDRKVRFDKSENTESLSDSPSSTDSQRGLVSRRGGRISSPARTTKSNPKESSLEFSAFGTPRQVTSDSTPSSKSDTPTKKSKEGKELVSAVKCDATPKKSKEGTDTMSRSAVAEKKDGEDPPMKKSSQGEKKNNVSFSPVPPPRTPVRSPAGVGGGRFQSLPSLDDDALRSPGSFFLSPNTPTPLSRNMKLEDTFDKALPEKRSTTKEVFGKPDARQPMRSPKTPRSPRTPKREDRDSFLATPTDFTTDYGKHSSSEAFDQSNGMLFVSDRLLLLIMVPTHDLVASVLAWLQSPTTNGLFSPGGFSSMLNTPRGAPRTPRTPTVSTSFFFSDVAGLPGGGEMSPKPGSEAKKNGGRGVSSIICISPLASSKIKDNINSGYTPTINYKDMFASPEKGRGLPLLGDSPMKGSKIGIQQSSSKDPSMDAVNMAERELMEDEDLSVLLQLASITPKANGERPISISTSEGTLVFRPTPNRKEGDENLPSLQLPIIGGREGGTSSTRLARKTHSRDHGDLQRPLGVLSSESEKRSDDSTTDSKKKAARADVKPSRVGSLHPGHGSHPGMMPPHHYSHPDVPYYPHMPQHTGSMRVVVGGPPRPKNSPSRSPHMRYPMGAADPNYPQPPYPPHAHYPHHHGVPPPHLHHYYSAPPHHAQHMQIYGAQHHGSKSKEAKASSSLAPAVKGQKRPLVQETPSKGPVVKKQKKASSPSGKKKNRSPQLVDKAERQKAAANIKAVNEASGGKNDKAAQLAAAILRGVTMRPSGKWQAQLYFAGKSRYIGVFDTREKAALAYEIAREKLKAEKQAEGGQMSPKATENAVNAARKAAFEGVNERDPRVT